MQRPKRVQTGFSGGSGGQEGAYIRLTLFVQISSNFIGIVLSKKSAGLRLYPQTALLNYIVWFIKARHASSDLAAGSGRT